MGFLRQSWAGVRTLLVFTVLLGLAYPLLMVGIGRLIPSTDGSVVRVDGRVVGSTLLGQAAGPEWFQTRPSASDDAGSSSGGSNLSPTSPEQAASMASRRAALVAANPDAVDPVPEDALTASGSGLDPDISPAYAAWQAPRIAKARSLALADVQALVASHTTYAWLGFIGADRVNTVELNLALATMKP
jgi:potassium-transporting ATPase KdpC subunit